ncbi:hypothetical protein VM57_12880 [Stenotrophomonas maltophilia]|uniref:Uncharacterized protein n=1 Tax=Stenotrophomonas maltophilia TaxID=40324 RepID=A0A0F5ZNB1_STEMA|nr:hypothetical protein VM57_12880 [Stenotrophomonas maltophilia]
MKAVLAAFQALEQAADHHPVPAQVRQHPVGVAWIDLRHIGPDLVEDGQQIVAAGETEEGAGPFTMAQPDRLLPGRVARGALADLQQQLTGDARWRVGRVWRDPFDITPAGEFTLVAGRRPAVGDTPGAR